MLKLDQLTKSFKEGFTLGPLNISIDSGATVALFGKNGAGKSTLFSVITGNADRTSGQAFWNGQKISPEAVELKSRMGYLPQDSDLPHWVTPEEILSWAAKLHRLGEDAVQHNIEIWDALEWKDKPLSRCSHGMQKRIGLALATMHNPDLLILDEAFNALDIYHTRTLENLIRKRGQCKLTTILSTHTPLIAANICDQAWIMEGGKLQDIPEWRGLSLEPRAQLIEEKFFAKK
ncbi:MAG: ABC transporter ATP-binding protein [Proteobacteria bacterium]|nr:ABC transporter ATP-binding protein [Pseudomonadota bacterium]